jgi:type I restriction enzyme S subunit
MSINENRPGYKKTKVGWIPEDWTPTKIGKLSNTCSGSTPRRSKHERYFKSGKHFWVKTTDLNNGIIRDTEELITDEALQETSCKLLPKDSIFVAMYGGFKQIGRTGLLARPAACNQALSAIYPSSKFCSKFLLYWLNLKVKYWIRFGASSRKDPNITRKDVNDFPVVLPPLEKQEKIAEILGCWDDGIEKLDKLIKKKEKYKKGLMQQLLTGKKRFREFEGLNWNMSELNHLFQEVTRKVGDKELIPYSISAGIGFVSQREKWGQNISGSQHKNYTHLKAEEFAYNKGNSKKYKQGCTYLLKEGEICVPNVFICFKAKNKEIIPEFYEQFFIANYYARDLKRYITSSARSDGLLNLSKKDFFKIKVPFPSLEEQKKIASILKNADREISLLKEKLVKLKSQKKGLMQKLLTGEVRVKI